MILFKYTPTFHIKRPPSGHPIKLIIKNLQCIALYLTAFLILFLFGRFLGRVICLFVLLGSHFYHFSCVYIFHTLYFLGRNNVYTFHNGLWQRIYKYI